MRLIDADELKDLRDKYIRGEVQFDDEQDLIDRYLTIPAEPIVNARWIHWPITRCSRCNWSIESVWKSKRCPECGAHMRNGE